MTVEFNGMLAAPGDRAAVNAACIDALFGQGGPEQSGAEQGGRFDALYLSGVPAHCLTWLQDRGLAARLKIRRAAPLVDLDRVRATGAAYEAGLSRNSRQQIRRARRLYAESGPLRLTRAADPDEALTYFDRLKALHQATWVGRGRPGAFAEPFFERFHRRLIRAAFATAASTCCTSPRAGESRLPLQPGPGRTGLFLPERLRLRRRFPAEAGPGQPRPGGRALPAGDFSAYHFMAGADRYKLSLANDSLDLDWIVIWNGRLIGLADRLRLAYRRLLRGPGGPAPSHD